MKIDDVVLAATNTYSLPEVCIKLRKAIDDPTVDTDKIAQIISSDPLLSAKILRLANSALFRFSNQVETISKALSILGMEATYNLVMADAAGQMKQVFQSELIDIDNYWYRCLFRGALAKELARNSRVRGTERFFVLGILCNLSEMVVASHFPAAYERYTENKMLTAPWHAQHAEFSFTFAKASSKICETWGLPMGLYAPLIKVFDVGTTHNEREVATLQLAIKLVMYDEGREGFDDLTTLEPEFSMWQQDQESLDDLLDFCRKEAKRLQNYL